MKYVIMRYWDGFEMWYAPVLHFIMFCTVWCRVVQCGAVWCGVLQRTLEALTMREEFVYTKEEEEEER